ncbi:sec7 domain protein [Ichthyophthirius multifiliis]|uniref:Sec7 domain protein n=1 Tax=Ichthyophthirius multifiliis TaxID=5932 RepID=G0QIP8_ICHMU|nr:sec7 domain protein [Ichthyophthirius multifiliis]EGR34878.1 sec7 domain protein [Ichthyophthirius multifiliis]|eukprot:XP_004040182.1 sec7 domain protein [Ichthyophthirius multifiliis]
MERFTKVSEENYEIYCNKRSISITKEGDYILTKLTSNQNLPQPKIHEYPLNFSSDHLNVQIGEYCQQQILNIVDQVCIFNKRKEIADKQNQNIHIPYLSVPPLNQENDPVYQEIVKAGIQNETNQISGKFGWCFICRKTAHNYCKDTRVSICSKECKNIHIQQINKIDYMQENKQNVISQTQYIEDGINIFKMLCDISKKDGANLNSASNPQNLKTKIISLDLLYLIMDNANIVFLSNFQQTVKEHLIDSLLRNLLSQEKKVVQISMNILINVFIDFRDNLKKEIKMFINDILLQMLESVNSSLHHRVLILEFFHELFKVPRVLLELFVNYDCALNQANLTEKIIEQISRISQGKYSKQEFQNSILYIHELHLRQLSLSSLVQIVQQLSEYKNENNSMSKTIDEYYQFGISNDQGQIEEQLKAKIQIQKAIQKLNYKIKEGLNFLYLQKLVQDPQIDLEKSIKQLSEFLYNQENIKRTTLGEFFGNESSYNQSVFSNYLEFISFKNISIDQGLRLLFKYIYPTGQAEQLDRILQMFGEKYVKDNQGIFKNASIAYTLAYAIMMLQTSLYNKQISEKDRMSLQAFKNLVKGISDGEDLPQQQIEAIYNSLKQNDIAIHGETYEQKNKNNDIKNQDMVIQNKIFKEEQRKMLLQGQVYFFFYIFLFIFIFYQKIIQNAENQNEDQNFIQVFNLNFTKHLLEVIWSPLFVTFSIELEKPESQFIDFSLKGIYYCLYLLGKNELNVQQQTFIVTLTKATGLLQTNNRLNQKNIKAIQILLDSSLFCGNTFRTSWKDIIECISKLDYYFSKAHMSKEILLQNPQNLETEIHNAELLINTFNENIIDKIFANTCKFESLEIYDFIQCLCELSKQEINNQNKARLFCMQRISEVAEFNMDRVRFEWNNIWIVLSQHFNYAGTSQNLQCACLAIDLLKQLSMKFLKKQELSHYSFQKAFLSPFSFIYNYTKATNPIVIYELILSCIRMITSINFSTIKSGWNVIIGLINQTIDNYKDINNMSLVILSFKIIDEIFIQDERSLEFLHEEMVSLSTALCKLVNFSQENIALNSIVYINRLLDYLFDNHQQQQQRKIIDLIIIQVFQVLGKQFTGEAINIQRKGLETMFRLIKKNCFVFTDQQFNEIWNSVILELLDNMINYFQKNSKDFDINLSGFMKVSCQIVFESITDIFSNNFQKTSCHFYQYLEVLEKLIGLFIDVNFTFIFQINKQIELIQNCN